MIAASMLDEMIAAAAALVILTTGCLIVWAAQQAIKAARAAWRFACWIVREACRG